ncbi:unnamed protein product [Rangifer tarandus platyrhynchus]|uniref:Secreted protein n=1 Tax=Rangifer tarandus platyrhynchus TaxID=3082113 RepID=A0ABN8XKL4_RANTA|nr:unnamed protein product [Rangifer tarandus platyrhynchus]
MREDPCVLPIQNALSCRRLLFLTFRMHTLRHLDGCLAAPPSGFCTQRLRHSDRVFLTLLCSNTERRLGLLRRWATFELLNSLHIASMCAASTRDELPVTDKCRALTLRRRLSERYFKRHRLKKSPNGNQYASCTFQRDR